MLTEDEKRAAIRRAWLMEEQPQPPFVVDAGQGLYATAAFLDHIAMDLARQEALCRDLAGLDGYFLPSLKPNLGIGVVAAAFGCGWITDSERDPWTRPLIGENNIAAVYGLSLPDPATSGMNALAFERVRYLREHSALPVRLVNVPSPLVTASLIWDYSSFIAATITHPKEVHFLLDLVTEATIQFVRLQVQEIGARLFALSHEPWYLRPELGIRVSDDTAQVMSPRGYREFGVPYNTRLSRAFGGIVIHSCGDVGHVLPAMLEIPGLRGVELVATQNDWQRLRDLTKGKVALSLRYCGWDFPDSEPPDLLAYSRELVDFFGRRGVLLWTQTDTLDSTRVLARKLEGAL